MQSPNQRYRQQQYNKVRDDSDSRVCEEDLRLIQARAGDRVVPVVRDGPADEDLDELDRQVGDEEEPDVEADEEGEAAEDAEDVGGHEEEGGFDGEGGGDPDDGACV